MRRAVSLSVGPQGHALEHARAWSAPDRVEIVAGGQSPRRGPQDLRAGPLLLSGAGTEGRR